MVDLGLTFPTIVTDKITHHKYDVLYECYLSPLRALRYVMLEIGIGITMDYGVARGYEMFKAYTPLIDMHGIEFDGEKTKATLRRIGNMSRQEQIKANLPTHTRDDAEYLINNWIWGDQSSEKVMQEAIDRYGLYDVVVDDGSHEPPHMVASITKLFVDGVHPGGVYIVEDIMWKASDPAQFVQMLVAFLAALHSEVADEAGLKTISPYPVLQAWLQRIDCEHNICAFVKRRQPYTTPGVSRVRNASVEWATAGQVRYAFPGPRNASRGGSGGTATLAVPGGADNARFPAVDYYHRPGGTFLDAALALPTLASHKVTRDRYEVLYEYYLAPLRDERYRMLEIGLGVATENGIGRGYELFKAYTPLVEMHAIEVDEIKATAQLRKLAKMTREEQIQAELPTLTSADVDDILRHTVWGDQSSGSVLQQTIQQFGPFDVIVDDGSHDPSHVIASFSKLFVDGLTPGGVYFVEGIRWHHNAPGPFVEMMKNLLSVMHINKGVEGVAPHTRHLAVQTWLQRVDCEFSICAFVKRHQAYSYDTRTRNSPAVWYAAGNVSYAFPLKRNATV